MRLEFGHVKYFLIDLLDYQVLSSFNFLSRCRQNFSVSGIITQAHFVPLKHKSINNKRRALTHTHALLFTFQLQVLGWCLTPTVGQKIDGSHSFYYLCLLIPSSPFNVQQLRPSWRSSGTELQSLPELCESSPAWLHHGIWHQISF